MDKHKDSHIEYPIQSYTKKNTYDVPSSVRHPKTAPSISLNRKMSHHMAKETLKTFKCEQKADKEQKKLQSEQKKLQSEQKTSSDLDTSESQDLAIFEGLQPLDGITRHDAIPVTQELSACTLARYLAGLAAHSYRSYQHDLDH